jgi:signal peptidase II
MTWKFFLYDWGGLNAALFQVMNQGMSAFFAPLAWVFSNLLGNYWTAPLVMLGLWGWSKSAGETHRALAIRQ